MTETRKVQIALAPGDGSAPETMAPAVEIAKHAARLDNVELEFVLTPMGWCAYEQYRDTLPEESMKLATKIGILFFGGVGETALDSTIGVVEPEMRPEGRCLLGIRDAWGLSINTRPAIYYPELRDFAKVRSETIPEKGIRQIWLRFLLEDSYFGNRHFADTIGWQAKRLLGVYQKHEITGNEPIASDIAYYRRDSLVEYFRYAFTLAIMAGLPLISVDKANVLPRYLFWRKIVKRIHDEEFPDVELRMQYSDNTTQMLFTPQLLEGVIACGNEHGDNLSDGALAAVGSMGMMYSSAINPKTKAAMFESGAGTYPEAKGLNIANPIGRILTAAQMLRHIGASHGADAIERAVRHVLAEGFRTKDIAKSGSHFLGTKEMGEKIFDCVHYL